MLVSDLITINVDLAPWAIYCFNFYNLDSKCVEFIVKYTGYKVTLEDLRNPDTLPKRVRAIAINFREAGFVFYDRPDLKLNGCMEETNFSQVMDRVRDGLYITSRKTRSMFICHMKNQVESDYDYHTLYYLEKRSSLPTMMLHDSSCIELATKVMPSTIRQVMSEYISKAVEKYNMILQGPKDDFDIQIAVSNILNAPQRCKSGLPFTDEFWNIIKETRSWYTGVPMMDFVSKEPVLCKEFSIIINMLHMATFMERCRSYFTSFFIVFNSNIYYRFKAKYENIYYDISVYTTKNYLYAETLRSMYLAPMRAAFDGEHFVCMPSFLMSVLTKTSFDISLFGITSGWVTQYISLARTKGYKVLLPELAQFL